MGSFIIQTCCLTTALMLSEEAFKRERERELGRLLPLAMENICVQGKNQYGETKKISTIIIIYRFCPQVVMKTSLLLLLLLNVYITVQ